MSRSRSARNVVGAVVVVGLIIVWWWPGLSGQDAQTDVYVLPSASMSPSREVIERRIREEGRVIVWHGVETDECSIEAPSETKWEVLVIGLPNGRTCSSKVVLKQLDVVRERFADRAIVVVLDWSDIGEKTTESLRESDFRVVDPRVQIGRAGEEQVCMWWDDCPADGLITTIEGGRLTEAGSQRLARSIVTGILE